MQKVVFFLTGMVFYIWGILGGAGHTPAFSMAPPPVVPVSEARAGLPSNTVRGNIDEVGRGFVIIDGKRFQVAVDVRVTNEEDGILEKGLNALRQQMKVELTLTGQTVTRIKVFGLLTR